VLFKQAYIKVVQITNLINAELDDFLVKLAA